MFGETYFEVSIIPHTLEETNLKYKKDGDIINLECDIIGKYIEKFVNQTKEESRITEDFLKENGF